MNISNISNTMYFSNVDISASKREGIVSFSVTSDYKAKPLVWQHIYEMVSIYNHALLSLCSLQHRLCGEFIIFKRYLQNLYISIYYNLP